MIVRRFAVLLSIAAIAACGAAATPTTTTTGTAAPAPAALQPPRRPSVAASPTPTATPTRIPIVPVAGFWNAVRDISVGEIRAAIAGGTERWRTVVGPLPLVAELGRLLGVRIATNVIDTDAAGVVRAVSSDEHALGILAAFDVTPRVRALAVDGSSLFGTRRSPALSAWPLLVPSDVAGVAEAGRPRFDPTRLWTLVAGGDVMLDRDVYRAVVLDRRGVDFPWDGGTVRIVHRDCCTGLGYALPVAEPVTGSMTVRGLFQLADVAVVNLEGPAIDDFTYHPEGHVFTFDPALLDGLRHAGIDLADLANNHVGNAGATGITETIAHLDALGIGHVGAGSDLAAARRPMVLATAGGTVAVLGYDDIDDGDHATSTAAGTAPLEVDAVAADIAAARRAGAAVVIVLTHWGVEYTARPTVEQRARARAILDAGADLIIGSHSHWAGAVGDASGLGAHGEGLTFFSLGDLVFDIDRSEETLEGLILELTFDGSRLVQVDLHPTLIVDLAQPNLLDVADAAQVLDRMRRASAATFDW
jgi:poly-gamma-glutamate synthesis protein (capsule biosynthesis protein)